MLLIGDDLTIIAYYVLRSESWKELEPGLQFLNDRLERLGTIEHVEAWWSDRCCEGAADVTQHPICAIFRKSNLKRAPYADTFHVINSVNKTANEGFRSRSMSLAHHSSTRSARSQTRSSDPSSRTCRARTVVLTRCLL